MLNYVKNAFEMQEQVVQCRHYLKRHLDFFLSEGEIFFQWYLKNEGNVCTCDTMYLVKPSHYFIYSEVSFNCEKPVGLVAFLLTGEPEDTAPPGT